MSKAMTGRLVNIDRHGGNWRFCSCLALPISMFKNCRSFSVINGCEFGVLYANTDCNHMKLNVNRYDIHQTLT